jgi:hypothetical protein
MANDHLGGAALNSGDRAQQRHRRLERGNLFLQAGRDRLDVVLEILDVREHALQQERVVGAKAAFQRLAQRRQLPAQLALRPLPLRHPPRPRQRPAAPAAPRHLHVARTTSD